MLHGIVIQRGKQRGNHIVGVYTHGYGIRSERHMENDIIAAHIVCTQGGRVVPAFRLQRSEAVDQIGYVFSGGIKRAVGHGKDGSGRGF